jgi:anaerobic ribonucleoside-triphosphate reductase activating protein
MLVSRVHFPVTALGWGTRVGIWTQGCTIGCRGCMAQDTWPATADHDVPVPEILRVVARCLPVDGVTVSGGEPLDQPAELVRLVAGLRDLLRPDDDVLCYSGRSRRVVESRFRNVLDVVDAIVVGPYDRDLPTDDPLRGSSNQEVLTCTPLGAARYAEPRERGSTGAASSGLQVAFDVDRVHTIGVPGPGDLLALEAAADAAGLRIADASWHDEQRDSG